jgi:hypothetical protein
VQFVVEVAKAREAVLAAIRRHGADLVVMGTRARRGPERWILGSVAEYVLRAAPVDVLAVPPEVAVGRSVSGRAGTRRVAPPRQGRAKPARPASPTPPRRRQASDAQRLLERANLRRIRAHGAARTRRNQARRDARGRA